MSTVTVTVHLDYDAWDHRETKAVRVSRAGRADVYLPQNEQAAGWWDRRETAHIASDIASRIGLDDDERARATLTDTASATERSDPRWIVTFEI